MITAKHISPLENQQKKQRPSTKSREQARATLQWYVIISPKRRCPLPLPVGSRKVNKHESAGTTEPYTKPTFHAHLLCIQECKHKPRDHELINYGGSGAKHELQRGLLVIRQAWHRPRANRLARRSVARMRAEPDAGGDQGPGAPDGRRL